jgi:hypothetical protein
MNRKVLLVIGGLALAAIFTWRRDRAGAKLTRVQHEALLKMVEYQRRASSNVVFTLQPDGVRPWGMPSEEVLIDIPRDYISLWHDLGYVLLIDGHTPDSNSYPAFILRRSSVSLLAS